MADSTAEDRTGEDRTGEHRAAFPSGRQGRHGRRIDGPGLMTIDVRLHEAPPATAAVLLVGGIGGGFDSPARGLYDRLSADLPGLGITAMRVRFRRPGDLDASTADVLAGVGHLAGSGADRLALVGHSFGGAVVIRAAAADDRVVAVCTLSAQSHGTEEVGLVAPRPLLAVHGTQDPVLPPVCSRDIVRRAGPSAVLELVDGAGHTFDAEADLIHDLVRDWLAVRLLDHA